ncbi:MAG: endo-1,4-beta-xylanase [Planctomycetota bacterium]|jgi:hypothetical protein
MLKFSAYRSGAPIEELNLEGAYMFGQDMAPVRAEIAFADGQVSCAKRTEGACGLSLLWDTGEAGSFMLPTTRLLDHDKPYNLNVELARAQLMRIDQKREDWGLFDYQNAGQINEEFYEVRGKLVESIKASDNAEASVLADDALADAIILGEKLALFHADILLSRRKTSSTPISRTGFGCIADLLSTSEEYYTLLREAFDFAVIPIPWKHTEPKERQYEYDEIDTWMDWAARARKPIYAGPILSFDKMNLPEWCYIWEHDYDSLRDVIYEHIQRIAQRYGKRVNVWNVVSGLNAHNELDLNFEQLMELTRMCCLLVKKLAPKTQVLIELHCPWGEYYARNQRTIPPILYADMAVQSGIKFDAFGLQMQMGAPVDGHYVRDLLQISSMLDQFVGFAKRVSITAAQVPSDVTEDTWDAWGGTKPVEMGGRWHAPWSQRLQAEWLQAFYRVAISKPFVDSICWRDLADYQGHYIPHGGLCRNNLAPKLAYKELCNFKALLAAPPTEQNQNQHQPPPETHAAEAPDEEQ